MTNPTLEQRARALVEADKREQDDVAYYGGPGGTYRPAQDALLAFARTEMLTFSHTGVEQAIEACAKVECDIGGERLPLSDQAGAPGRTELSIDRAKDMGMLPEARTPIADVIDRLDLHATMYAVGGTPEGPGNAAILRRDAQTLREYVAEAQSVDLSIAAQCEQFSLDIGIGRPASVLLSEAANLLRSLPGALPLPAQSPDDIAYAGAVQEMTDPEETDTILELAWSSAIESQDYRSAWQIAFAAGRKYQASASPVNVEGLVDGIRATIVDERRTWFCSGQDCDGFDSGRDEGFDLALAAFDRGRQALASLSPDGER